MTTISERAGIAYDALERRTREDGETFTTMKDDAPEWVRTLVYDAHGEFLPEDWRYDAIRAALGAIHDSGAEDVDELGDLRHEWADGHVDVYTADRLRWLASNLNRPSYCDEATEQFGSAADSNITEQIGWGQYMESCEVFDSVAQSLANHGENID